MPISDLSGPPYGNYDQCLSIKSPYEANKPTITGHYCGLDSSIYAIKNQYLTEEMKAKLMTNANELPFNVTKFVSNIIGRFGTMMFNSDMKSIDTKSIDLFNSLIDPEMKIINGFCLPSTCKTEDISHALNQCENGDLLSVMTKIPKDRG